MVGDELNPISLGQGGSAAAPSVAEQNAEVDKHEFIKLLVTQLKHQDPLDPMDNEEFAVQLAQFTQVEQLISINDKLDAGASPGGGEANSLASYLGNEVWLNSDVVSVKGGDAGEVAFNLDSDVADARIELVDKEGLVRESLDIGALTAGTQRVSLTGLSSVDGDYQARVVATGLGGEEITPEVSVAGIVNGFVPGLNPTLLIGDREVNTADIKRVNVPV